MIKKQSIKYYVQFKSLLQNERGAQTLEWVAVGAVVVTIAALLGTAFKDSTGISDIVTKIIDKIKSSI